MRAAAAACIGLAAIPSWPSDRIIAGFGEVRPLHYSDPQGNATGFVVDALNEAARRENIQVEWKRVAGSNAIEPALADKRIDIFPAGIITDARQVRYWVSEPWWTEDISILIRADLGTDSQIRWTGRRVVLASPAYIPFASSVAPGARFDVPAPNQLRGGPDWTASLICNGSAEAALMSHAEVEEVLARRPTACRDVHFQVLETVHSLPLALLARQQSGRLAARLRSRIDQLTLDGTLAAIAERYPRTSARSAVRLAETLRLRYERRTLWTAFGATLFAALLATGLLMRQLRIQRALRRAMAEQERTEQVLLSRTQELAMSNEELQAFAYSISHDLQEPLRTIALYTEMFERRAPPASRDARYYLATIRTSALRMQEMMQKLLLLSRIGRSDVPRIPVSIADVLASILRDLEPLVKATSAEIIIGPMPTIVGWPDRLSVLFQNLISNALKYRSENAAPRIEITATPIGAAWNFCVRDNGIGFDQRHAENIFGVFKRLHVQDKYGGTGVGLAIAKRAVERHGGRIWAEGRPDEGSSFYFTLPAQPVPDVSEQYAANPPVTINPA